MHESLLIRSLAQTEAFFEGPSYPFSNPDFESSKKLYQSAVRPLQSVTKPHVSSQSPTLERSITFYEKPTPLVTNRRGLSSLPEMQAHPTWSLMRVISGHTGWVRSVAVEPQNEWFVTGASDRTIKLWDLASGTLKLTLTGHISTIRGLAVSDRSPYLYSAGEDKLIKCWDLESNRVIRHYHGHLQGIYCLTTHPSMDLLITAGRDAVVRVWDIRTKQPIYGLAGHTSTIHSVLCQEAIPQIISGSADSTVKTWDLRTGKCHTTLTHHKKSIRALALHSNTMTFLSASPEDIKKFGFSQDKVPFLHSLDRNNVTNAVTKESLYQGDSLGICNTLAINQDNVVFGGFDNGQMAFWDYGSGKCFQRTLSMPQPGSIDSEAGIYASSFDKTGLRLITCEADKSIKIWKESICP